MRFLKNKILRAQQAHKVQTLDTSSSLDDLCINDEDSLFNDESTQLNESPDDFSNLKGGHENRSRQPKNSSSRRNDSSMKNIALNFGKAIASFAMSPQAIPHLKDYLDQQNITLADFLNFIKGKKGTIGGICSFRSLLLVEEGDPARVVSYKKAFQFISEVFIKYHSVNWIMNGRVTHKSTYLKFRFSMLRRVQNPESFTFIKERKPGKNVSRG